MAKTKQPLEKIPSELLIPKDEAELKLKERILKCKEIIENPLYAYDELKKLFDKWDDFNNELLKRIFTSDEYQNRYMWAGYQSPFYEESSSQKISSLIKESQEKIHYIETLIEKLELIPVNASIYTTSILPISNVINNKKVFIVHGRDEVAKASLEILLHEMGLEAVVLHRQADEGQTIIEKFEKHSDVGYAFILLTPDEIAYVVHEDSLPDDKRQKEKRARPNVVFEFGYFVGRLGRNKVCCVYTGDVSLPSDVSGMIYKKYISSIEEVAYSITKDLKAVGIIN